MKDCTIGDFQGVLIVGLLVSVVCLCVFMLPYFIERGNAKPINSIEAMAVYQSMQR